MIFKNENLKINLDSKIFYATISVLSIFVTVNTIFFAASMNPVKIIPLINETNSFNKIQIQLIVNYSVQMGICIVFAITLTLSLYRIRIGYIFTSISTIGFTAIVFIPIILSSRTMDYRSIINIILFILIQIAIAFIYKEIFLYRKINKMNQRSKRGIAW